MNHYTTTNLRKAPATFLAAEATFHSGPAGWTSPQDRISSALQQSYTMMKDAPACLSWVAEDGTILGATRMELDTLGFEEAEYVGGSVLEHHVDKGEVREVLDRLRYGGTVDDHPAKMRRKDNSILDVTINANVLWDAGNFVCSRWCMFDISRHGTRSEFANARVGAGVAAMENAIIEADLDGTIVYWNKNAESLYGFSQKEARGQSLDWLESPGGAHEVAGIVDLLLNGRDSETYDAVHLGLGHRLIPVTATLSLIKDMDGIPAGLAMAVCDRSHREPEDEDQLVLINDLVKALSESQKPWSSNRI